MNEIIAEVTLYGAVGTGIIVNWQSGVTYTTQAGGSACYQMKLEGVYIPLGNDVSIESNIIISPEIDLVKYFGSKYPNGSSGLLDTEDIKSITVILNKFDLGFIEVDLKKLNHTYEAWVYVNINPDKDNKLFSGFGENLKGVLTWSNSD